LQEWLTLQKKLQSFRRVVIDLGKGLFGLRPILSDLSCNRDQLSILVPDLAIFFQEAAGNKTGAEDTFEPVGRWYITKDKRIRSCFSGADESKTDNCVQESVAPQHFEAPI
jgi:hypothetical protein